MKLKPIYTGYKNALLRKNEQVERKAQQRLRVCAICPMKKIRAGVSVCGQCGCPLSALTRQDEKVCINWKKYNV
ncbi:hypothetical protein RCZ02_23720 [Capnocytophaga felis]|uniref:hypothetical protein n=1 Tax=Capnocytophaga felis TaxID=2267611 RepID=UPI0012C3095A|nr:hypothetical protein [Capnocytophaga felis]GET49541.1 hypothetical protein RCZ02_23720 [Capnocytophaga felis]